MKILLVDDSYLIRSILKEIISSVEGFQVAGEAGNGQKAIEMAKELEPDLILMDVNMPVMDGIEATGRIMEIAPVPIVILTSEDISEVGYKALNNGALELIPKPSVDKMNAPGFIENFKSVLENISKYGKFRIQKGRKPRGEMAKSAETKPERIEKRTSTFSVLAIGASTGGPAAVRTLLSGLPGDFPLPIIISQHIEEGFDAGYASWLNSGTELTVRLAKETDTLQAGTALVAPATRHLLCQGARIYCDDSPRYNNQKPSVDKMFTSVAKKYGKEGLAVLLTGMGQDGAEGCVEIVTAGGTTLVQDEESSLIYGMPKAAAERNGASRILPLDKMASTIKELCRL
ncbi:MAG: chemotaxis-specific protein-glutamate methyltransferase CheB [Spirochaetales bacterium]|nr:chemotaxis-specific protein-glutamate methyltransferase CheB [Spirochaetales bacterium]